MLPFRWMIKLFIAFVIIVAVVGLAEGGVAFVTNYPIAFVALLLLIAGGIFLLVRRKQQRNRV